VKAGEAWPNRSDTTFTGCPCFKLQRNQGVTEIVEAPNRGHALVIDSGWREVAETALAFVQRFVSPDGTRHADSHAAALA
jgi:hypothetical protein